MATSRFSGGLGAPSALLTDGLLSVPLHGLSRLSLSERYSLPPIGVSAFRAAVGNSEDTISLAAVLVGPDRFLHKQALEMLASVSRRASLLSTVTGGASGGLLLVSRLVTRRDVVDVSLSLRHVPRPGPGSLLLDVATAGVASMVDPLGGG